MKLAYDYYQIGVPSDCATDPEDRRQLAINEARDRARLFAIPATWIVRGDDGETVSLVRVRPATTQPRQHYHVLLGMHGYLPNANVLATSRRQAEALAASYAAEARQNGDQVTGRARDGYYDLGVECIEIAACTDPECIDSASIDRVCTDFD